MASDLKTKTLSGMLWSFVQRFGKMVISFSANIVLARLLSPDDYGIIGMLMIFISVSDSFIDGGFGSALIQKKNPTKEDYSTIFWWNMLLSLAIYGLLFVSAPAIARFYNQPILSDVLRVQGIILIFHALSIIQRNQLRKHLKFKRLATVTIVSATISSIIAIILAWIGWGVWALVAQQLLINGFATIMLWVINKWTPSLIFSKKSFKELFGFGGYILGSSLVNRFCNELNGLLIGRFFSPAILGFYTQAYKLEQIASTSFSSVIEQVSYPVLSELQNDNNALKRAIKKLTTSIAYITMPMMLAMALVAHPVILFLYTEKWLPSAYYLQVLCIAGVAVCLQNISFHAVASKGESRDLFIWTVVKRAIGILIIVIGMVIWDIHGLIWGAAIVAWCVLFVNFYLVGKHIGYKFWQQIKDLLPILILSSVVYAIVYMLNQISPFGVYVTGILSVILYAALYIGISYALKLEVLGELQQLIKERLKRKK